MRHQSQQAAISSFRPDIEGLRAIAVFGVLIFHLDASWLPGGFTGVDIFYVISGFIITRQLLSQNNKGSFSIVSFWIRRIRRLYPAMLSVIVLTLIAGFWLVTPEAYQETAESGLAAIFMGANIFFADRVGYFAPNAGTRELLHLWSLSFEQQFYLIISLLFFFKPNKRVVLSVLVIVTIASFIACLILLETKPDKAFYLPFGRFWEVAIGGLMAVWLERKPLKAPENFKLAITATAYFSLFMLLMSFVFIRAELGFPGIQTLVPVIATSALILIGSPTPALNFLLTNKVTRWHGRISYTLYLVHWPVIVLMKKADPDISNTFQLLMTITIIYALTITIHYLIEMPLRISRQRPKPNRPQFATLCAITLVAIGYVVIDKGSNWRLPERAAKINDYYTNPPKTGADQACVSVTEFLLPERANLCRFGEAKSGESFLLIGDSHMGVMSQVISSEALKKEFNQGFRLSLPPSCPLLIGVSPVGRLKVKKCASALNDIAKVIRKIAPQRIYLVSRWANFGSNIAAPGDNGKPIKLVEIDDVDTIVPFSKALARTLRALEPAKITIVGPIPEQPFHVPNTMIRSAMLSKNKMPMSLGLFQERQSIILDAFAKLGTKIEVVYPHKILCSKQGCNYAQGDLPLYYDDDHLTQHGAELLRPLFTR